MIQEPARLTPTPPQPPAPRRSTIGSSALRAAVVIGMCLVIAVPVVLALDSAPQPANLAAGASAAATATDGTKSEPARPGKDKAPKFNAKAFLGAGRGPITITAISGANLSLATEDGWKRTIAVTSDTKITKGGQTIAASDLMVGDQIRFSQKRNDDGTYAITSIVVPTPMASGVVTAVTANTFTIKKRGGTTQVITVNASTVYTLGKAKGAKSDVTVGSNATVSGTVTGSTFTALSVKIALSRAAGEVTAISGSTITVKKGNAAPQVVTVTSSTAYSLGKAKGSKSDVKVGSRITASGTVSGSTFTALTVNVALDHAAGDVTAKTSATITIKGRGGKTTVIHVSSSTTFKVKGKDAATIADIAVGDRLQADGVRRSDGSMDATSVTGRAPKAPKARRHRRPPRPRARPPASGARTSRSPAVDDGIATVP